MKAIYFLIILSLLSTVGGAQQTSVAFEKYRSDPAHSVLPDFSYAGYHHGEIGIPSIEHYKVFNVLDYGAVPNDELSDKKAIQAAIHAANANGSGIVFFPPGKFLVNEMEDPSTSIVSKGSRIIFRGSGTGPGGTELYMKNTLPPAHPTQMWTVPPLFLFTAGGADKKIGVINAPAKTGAFTISVDVSKGLAVGDWVTLKMLNNDSSLIASNLAPHQVDSTWTYMVKKGIDIQLYCQVVAVSKNSITLHAPLPVDVDPRHTWEVYTFSNAEEIGIEHIAFVGNWKEKFVHHRSWKDDSGFTLFRFSRCTNSWMNDCRFTDCSVAAVIVQSANISILNSIVTGNGGHEAICSNNSTNVLMANLRDEASMWHSFGSSHGAINTVIWNCSYPSTTCFESHASQPRNTLLDNVKGGLMQNRGGGAIENMPNHLKGLVFWNYQQTNAPVKDFEFWSSKSVYWKIPDPVVIGFQGNGTSFKNDQLAYLESLDHAVQPASLYKAQLEWRLKKTPEWMDQKTARPSTAPNLLVIMVDQWRAQAQGYEKKEPVKTPELDRLAGQSLVLSQMVSNYPLCSPARAMFFSGQYPLKNHVYSNVNSGSAPQGIELNATTVCWSDVLKEQGYSNGYIGKWHLDSPHEPYVPTSNNNDKIAWNEWTSPDRRHGFDYWNAYGTYDVHNNPMYWETNATRDQFYYAHEWGPIHEANKAISFFKNDQQQRDPSKPFSLVVSINPPHSGYNEVPAKYYQLYKDIPIDSFLHDPNIPAAGTEMGEEYRKNIKYYYACITGVDEQIGRILQALKDQGLSENTIVVFTADHGNCLGKHEEVSKNNVFEESLRIPMIIHWKGHILPRYDSSFLGNMPDMFPSLLAMMGFEKKIPAQVDGKNYASYLINGKGDTPHEQFIMGAIPSNNVRVNTGFRGIRTKAFKLAYQQKNGKSQGYLFDLRQDPFELHNLYQPNHKMVQQLNQQLNEWLTRTGDSFSIPTL